VTRVSSAFVGTAPPKQIGLCRSRSVGPAWVRASIVTFFLYLESLLHNLVCAQLFRSVRFPLRPVLFFRETFSERASCSPLRLRSGLVSLLRAARFLFSRLLSRTLTFPARRCIRFLSFLSFPPRVHYLSAPSSILD